MEEKKTSFQTIYDAFLNLITDDMYLEWSEAETYADIRNIFMSALSNFQFPRFKLYDFVETDDVIEVIEKNYIDEETGEEKTAEIKIYAEEDYFNDELTLEEINIIAHLMVIEWLTRQLASIEVVRQAYSSRDFEFTSQANHLDKLIKLRDHFSTATTKMQRMYTRRKLVDGRYVPNYQGFGGKHNAY